ncbi:MAG TPA: hypothetical protein VFF31_28950 [Blastocatellia bacterium]|nr:hypothetical protein [Blastocatellia bacterium]
MNKQDNCEDDIQTESMADLPLTGAQAEETKGGPTLSGTTGTFRLTFQGQTTTSL